VQPTLLSRIFSHFSPEFRRKPRSRPELMLIVILGICPRAAGGATFYVDGQHPAATDAGPGSPSQPFRTLSGAVAARHGPGVTLLVKPGTYPEQVVIPASGSPTSPFVLRAQGDPVVLDGADDFADASRWIQYSGDVWLATGVDWSPRQVFADGSRLVATPVAPASLPSGSFLWVSGAGLYVNVGGGNPGLRAALVGRRSYGFYASGKSWVTLEGFTVTRAESRAVQLTNCTGVTLARNTLVWANDQGVHADGGSAHVIEGNVVSDNGDHGIALTDGAAGCVVRDNESSRNARPEERAANGIYLFRAPGNTLVANRLHDNQDSGIHIKSGSDNTACALNLSWNNGDHGYDDLYVTGTIHVCDVAYGNYRDGFSIEGSATGTQLFNCIAVDNGLATGEFDLWIDASSTNGFVSNYNIFWNSTSQPPIKYGTTTHALLGSYASASGQDVASLQVDPGFADPPAGDFRLRSSSPAIDSGHSGAPFWPSLDAVGRDRLDENAILDTGAGPVTFSDRGALEFGPDRPPIVTCPGGTSGWEGETLTFTVSAVDPDRDAITALTATALPPGAVFTPGADNAAGTFSWTPTAGQTGSFTVTFSARNGLTGSTSTDLQVSEWRGPPLHARVSPVPMRSNAILSFRTSRPGELLVELFDASGRRVRELLREPYAPAGLYELSISGQERRSALSAGMYFFRIRAEEGNHSGRFVIIR